MLIWKKTKPKKTLKYHLFSFYLLGFFFRDGKFLRIPNKFVPEFSVHFWVTKFCVFPIEKERTLFQNFKKCYIVVLGLFFVWGDPRLIGPSVATLALCSKVSNWYFIEIYQDLVNICFVISRCLNGTFSWRKCLVNDFVSLLRLEYLYL